MTDQPAQQPWPVAELSVSLGSSEVLLSHAVMGWNGTQMGNTLSLKAKGAQYKLDPTHALTVVPQITNVILPTILSQTKPDKNRIKLDGEVQCGPCGEI